MRKGGVPRAPALPVALNKSSTQSSNLNPSAAFQQNRPFGSSTFPTNGNGGLPPTQTRPQPSEFRLGNEAEEAFKDGLPKMQPRGYPLVGRSTTPPFQANAHVINRGNTVGAVTSTMPLQNVGNVQENPNKRTQMITTEENDFDAKGMLKVASDRIKQLEEEVSRLRAVVHLKEAQQIEQMEKTIAKREDALLLREKEIEEANEILHRSMLQERSSASAQSRKDTVIESTLPVDSNVSHFFMEAWADILTLLRYESNESKFAENKEMSSPTIASPLVFSRQKNFAMQTPPATPLSGSVVFLAPHSGAQVRLDLPKPAFKSMDDMGEGFAIAGSLFTCLSQLQSSEPSADGLVMPLLWFIEERQRCPQSVVSSAVRVLYIAAKHFPSFWKAAVSSSTLIDGLLTFVETGRALPMDVDLVRLFQELVRNCLVENLESRPSLKLLSPLLQGKRLLNKCDRSNNMTLQQETIILISWLLTKGSDAVPSGFPELEETWKDVSPPFSSASPLNIDVCLGMIACHGQNGARFLVHHGLVARLITHMYNCQLKGCPDARALTLLFQLISLCEFDLGEDDQHKLLACLIGFKDSTSCADGILTSSQAESILRAVLKGATSS